MRNRLFVTLTFLLITTANASAEIKLPQASPGITVSHELGISDVKVVYHRPGVKGRKIWGELVPFGKVWRLGANEATTLQISHPMKIAGKDVPAGQYSLFAIPSQKEWTFILNKKPEQWGAYAYDEKEDLVRFTAKTETGPHAEWMEIMLRPVSATSLHFEFAWDTLRTSFPIEADVTAIVWKSIDAALASTTADWETYHQAARYALDTDIRLSDGLSWIDKAMTNESFWNHEVKARLLHKTGKHSEALEHLAKAKELAKGKAPQEYIDGLDKTLAEWSAVTPAASGKSEN